MKNIIKLIAVIIAAVMTLTLLAACQQDKPADTKPETTAAKTDTEKETEKETEPDTTEPDTTEEVTTEEVTTEEVTTEPQPEVRYDVLRWDFNDASNLGWEATNKTEVIAEEDGTIHLNVTGGDPHITTKRIPGKIECEDVEYIVIRIKNKTDAYTGQLFISTTDSPGPAEQYSYKYDYDYADEDDEWEIIEIDTLDINGWSGKLRSLRFDYSDGSEGDCYIDYIALQTTDASKQGSVETEEVVDPRAGKQVLYKWDFSTLTADDIYLSSKAAETEEGEGEGEGGEEEYDPRWHFSGGVEDAYVENGHLVIKIGGQDPFMTSPEMTEAFDCSAVSAIVIKACNKTAMTSAQLFFTSDELTNYSEAGSVRFSFDHKGADNDVFEEIVIVPSDSTLWEGQLLTIRIDPSEEWEGIVLLDYCELWG